MTDTLNQIMRKFLEKSPHVYNCGMRVGDGRDSCNCGLYLLMDLIDAKAAPSDIPSDTPIRWGKSCGGYPCGCGGCIAEAKRSEISIGFDEWCASVKDCGHEVQPNSATSRQRKLGWDAAMATKREIIAVDREAILQSLFNKYGYKPFEIVDEVLRLTEGSK